MIKTNHIIKRKITVQPVSFLILAFSIFALKVNVSPQFFHLYSGRKKNNRSPSKKDKNREHYMPSNSLDKSEEYGVEVDTGIRFSFSLVTRF